MTRHKLLPAASELPEGKLVRGWRPPGWTLGDPAPHTSSLDSEPKPLSAAVPNHGTRSPAQRTNSPVSRQSRLIPTGDPKDCNG